MKTDKRGKAENIEKHPEPAEHLQGNKYLVNSK